MTHEIKTATAVYTGGGIYVFYGQLENGLYFQVGDQEEPVYICDSETGTEESYWWDFYEKHTIEELTGNEFKEFWNAMLTHIINGGAAHGNDSNYATYELEERLLEN